LGDFETIFLAGSALSALVLHLEKLVQLAAGLQNGSVVLMHKNARYKML